jgi:predicted acyltransferase
MATSSRASSSYSRLDSLDVLRGMDMFLLTVIGPLTWAFARTGEYGWLQPVLTQFEHVGWEGFRLWDIIMPLFMFLSGVTIPFAFSRERVARMSRGDIALRMVRRVLLLWLFGMIVQGNLLSLDPSKWRWYSNTLQTIAVGWLASSLLFLFTRTRTRIIVAAVLLVTWWAVMMWMGADGSAVGLGVCGHGDWTPDGNLCEYIDRVGLGAHRDGASLADDGTVVFASWYRYTWLLSSLNFIVTVLLGVLAGELLRSKQSDSRKTLFLLVGGAALAGAGWLAHGVAPVIKHIWSSSFTLVAAGYSWLALGVMYWLVDVRGHRKAFSWLKVWGTNAIVAYMFAQFPRLFSSIPHTLLWGLNRWMSDAWYALICTTVTTAIPVLLLVYLYRRKLFVRV